MADQDQTKEPTTTPTTTSKLKEKFQLRLEEAKQRLEKAKQDIAEIREEDKEGIRKKSAEIQQELYAQRDRAKELRNQIAGWLQDKKQQTDEQIGSWRQKREIKHLEKRADRAEEYAANAVVMAMIDADEAEIAVLDALDARLDAEAAVPSAP